MLGIRENPGDGLVFKNAHVVSTISPPPRSSGGDCSSSCCSGGRCPRRPRGSIPGGVLGAGVVSGGTERCSGEEL
ncbi:Mannan-Binding Lectin Serine Protease 2 [Manis pentadactyla]|nr:Mannan-Binding Lectin Serine Protease 2 [Manis pentadactyla]